MWGTKFDWDKTFYYDTKQVVRVQDRILAAALYLVYFMLTMYIILGVFIYGEGYLSYDQTQGGIATHVKGDTVAVGSKGTTRYFSAEEITYPGLENGNVFVATRESVQRERRGTCEDRNRPCSTDEECTKALGGTCSPRRFCKEPSWCPTEDPEKYDLGTKDVEIWIKSFIHYNLLDRNSKKDPFLQGMWAPPFIYSTVPQNRSERATDRGYNIFSIGELLAMCKPVPVRYEEISELGAAIEVVFTWKCDMAAQSKCVPQIKARRVDVLFDPQHIGFAFKWSEEVGVDERIAHEMRGVRILFRTVGQGSMADTNAIVLKWATTTSLLCVAPIIADLCMLKLFQNKKRFSARKHEQSPKFGVYLDELEQKRKRQMSVSLPAASVDRLDEDQRRFQRRIREENPDED